MKCLYYLSPDLDATRRVSEEVKTLGISEWFMHVISRDEAGLKREHIHSSNYLETRDILRDGFIGANIGFIAAVLLAGLFMWLKPFGDAIPTVAYFFIVAVFTLFGAWVGGLIGLDTENKKIRRFHDDIEAGKYVILLYVTRDMEDTVRAAMKERHPDVRLVGVDRHFMNPFSGVRRRRRRQTA